MKRYLSALFAVLVLVTSFTSCVTNTRVTFETDVPGADVYIDDRLVGQTPITEKMSNAVWRDPDIDIEIDGYRAIRTELDKEIKVVNLIFGLTIWWPSLLWVYGPDNDQYYRLRPTD
ncbi:MAG: PEGA domain-containing protein [Spirochaeta sp.]|jgi:hypothetical protein|nr:PEGA domain-containing protein [Spirochaeta sp.]